jgi:hypothetical protein
MSQINLKTGKEQSRNKKESPTNIPTLDNAGRSPIASKTVAEKIIRASQLKIEASYESNDSASVPHEHEEQKVRRDAHESRIDAKEGVI